MDGNRYEAGVDVLPVQKSFQRAVAALGRMVGPVNVKFASCALDPIFTKKSNLLKRADFWIY